MPPAAATDDHVFAAWAATVAGELLTASRVWIIDPLDGTREFSEPPRDDWAVHVALWQDGELVAGAVAQPGLGHHFRHRAPPGRPAAVGGASTDRGQPHPPARVRRGAGRRDRRGPGADGVGRRQGDLRGPRRHRRLRARGRDVRVGLAAPVAVARAAGLHTCRIDGSPLVYNQEDVMLPDLVVCRPELADSILDYIARAGVE